MKMKLNLSLPDEYSWSVNLEVYEIFVIGTLQWLKMNGLLREEYKDFKWNAWEPDSKAMSLSGTLEQLKDMTHQ